MKQPAIGMAPVAAANFSTARRPVFSEEMADVHWAFNDNDGMSCQQKLLQGSLQTFPFVDMLLFES